jgi:hypothetical protein
MNLKTFLTVGCLGGYSHLAPAQPPQCKRLQFSLSTLSSVPVDMDTLSPEQ